MRVPRHVISRALTFFYQHIYCTLRLFFSPTSLRLIVVISVLGHYHIILGSHLAYGHAGSWSDTDRFAKSIYNRPQLKRFHWGPSFMAWRRTALLYVLVHCVHYTAPSFVQEGFGRRRTRLEYENGRTIVSSIVHDFLDFKSPLNTARRLDVTTRRMGNGCIPCWFHRFRCTMDI